VLIPLVPALPLNLPLTTPVALVVFQLRWVAIAGRDEGIRHYLARGYLFPTHFFFSSLLRPTNPELGLMGLLFTPFIVL